jgi:hypothetical protein
MSLSGDTASEVTRYCFDRSQIRTSNSTVKHNLFVPPSNLRLSVYVTDGYSDQQVWSIGRLVEQDRGKTLRAKAIVRGDLIRQHALRIDLDNVPRDRHANVVDWPDSEPQQLHLAHILANAAQVSFPSE